MRKRPEPMNEPMLPDSDSDLLLARLIGRQLEGQADAAPPENDPLWDALASYRQAVHTKQETLQPDAATSDRIWAAIDRETRPPQTARIYQLSPTIYRMAIAASLLVAVAVTWMLLRPAPRTLVASADATPMTYTTPDGSQVTLRPQSQLFALGRQSLCVGR